MIEMEHLCSNRFLAEKSLDGIDNIKVIKEKGKWYYEYRLTTDSGAKHIISMIVFACPLCGRKLE